MTSGESSSLAISSESFQADHVMGVPNMAQGSDSRSSSICSVLGTRN